MVKIRYFDDSFYEDMNRMNLSTMEKAFYTYLFTNKKIKHCGVFKLSIKDMAAESNMSMDLIIYLLDELENKHDLIRYNPVTEEIAVKNWFKYDVPLSDELKLHIAMQYLSVRDKSLIDLVKGAGIILDFANSKSESGSLSPIDPENIIDFGNDVYYQCILDYANDNDIPF